MKIETYIEPESAFLSVDKDLSIIVERMLKNDNLKKLLHYTNNRIKQWIEPHQN